MLFLFLFLFLFLVGVGYFLSSSMAVLFWLGHLDAQEDEISLGLVHMGGRCWSRNSSKGAQRSKTGCGVSRLTCSYR